MKIVVCGDSFCTATVYRPGTHFSELLQQAGHEVVNLSRGGISNTGIAFQLQESVKFKPDVVVFSTTDARLTIPTGKQKFNRHLGLKNFCYPYQSDASSTLDCVGGTDAAIWADVASVMLSPRSDLPNDLHLSDAQLDAIKKYLAYLFDAKLQNETDSWLIGFWVYKLKDMGVKCLQLEKHGLGKQMYDYVIANPTLANQIVYHTDQPTQKLVAKDILDRLESGKFY